MKNKKELWIINHYATPPGYGGLTRHFYLAKYLQKLGFDVKIFASSAVHNSSFNFIEKKEKKLFKETNICGVKYVHIKTNQYSGNKIGRIMNIIQYYFRCKKVLKLYSKNVVPDYIYSSSPHPLSPLIANKFAKKHKIESIVETRDLWPETIVSFGILSKKHPLVLLLNMIQKKIYTGADKLVFTMEGGEEYLRTLKYYDKLGKVYWVNNGYDGDDFNNKESIDDNDLDNSNTFKVIYTGSIRYAYQVDNIVKVAQSLQKENKNIVFLIYGKGPYLEELKKYCLDNKIRNVKFKGFIDNKFIPYVLSKVDLCLLHGKNHSVFKYGTSQNKLFTYLASGKPIISTFLNKYDLITRYNCGKSVDIDNLEQYKEAILYFYNLNKEQYIEYCNNSLKVAKNFEYKVLAKKLKDVLEQ